MDHFRDRLALALSEINHSGISTSNWTATAQELLLALTPDKASALMALAGEHVPAPLLRASRPVSSTMLFPGGLLLLIGFAFAGGFTGFSWLLWIFASVLVVLSTFVFALYNIGCMVISFGFLLIFKICRAGRHFARHVWSRYCCSHQTLWQSLDSCRTYREWLETARELDLQHGGSEWRNSDEGFPQQPVVARTTRRLREMRLSEQNRLSDLCFLLTTVLKRDYLGLDSPILHACSSTNKCLSGSKLAVHELTDEVVACLRAVADAPPDKLGIADKIGFFRNAQRSLGRTALCLSGGGSLAMYHIGVVAELLEQGVLPDVISGSSGGSIVAGMLAVKTEQELRDQVIQEGVSTDFTRDGRQRREKICWFPPIAQQILHFLRNGVLLDSQEFRRCCRFHFSDLTFREAYERTGRSVAITISASTQSAAASFGGPRKLLLSHHTTPHVLVYSAVATSCCLPGIMRPTTLLCKSPTTGRIVPYGANGAKWLDGSMRADVPLKDLQAVLGANYFIVSQVNPHVVPFLRGSIGAEAALRRKSRSCLGKLERHLIEDIQHRVRSLGTFGLMPRVYGQDIRKVFKQKYHGNVTILPRLTGKESAGLKAIQNPTRADMRHYILGGRQAAWPEMQRITLLTAAERCIQACLGPLLREFGSGSDRGPQFGGGVWNNVGGAHARAWSPSPPSSPQLAATLGMLKNEGDDDDAAGATTSRVEMMSSFEEQQLLLQATQQIADGGTPAAAAAATDDITDAVVSTTRKRTTTSVLRRRRSARLREKNAAAAMTTKNTPKNKRSTRGGTTTTTTTGDAASADASSSASSASKKRADEEEEEERQGRQQQQQLLCLISNQRDEIARLRIELLSARAASSSRRT